LIGVFPNRRERHEVVTVEPMCEPVVTVWRAMTTPAATSNLDVDPVINLLERS